MRRARASGHVRFELRRAIFKFVYLTPPDTFRWDLISYGVSQGNVGSEIIRSKCLSFLGRCIHDLDWRSPAAIVCRPRRCSFPGSCPPTAPKTRPLAAGAATTRW